MKKFWIPALAGMTLWAVMTLTEAALEITQPSQAAQSTYAFTLIANFGPSGLIPSNHGNGPVITNDGTVVYSVAFPFGTPSSIFSSDGTVTRLLLDSIEHQFRPLAFSVSGNGMMVTNGIFPREIIDVHDGAVLGQLNPGDGFFVASGVEGFYQVSINNRGSVAFTGSIVDQCLIGSLNGGVFRFDDEITTTIAKFGLLADVFTVFAFPSINESVQGDDLAIYKRAGWESFTGLGNVRELICEKVSSPRPKRHSGGIPSSKTAVAVELNFVEPFLALWQTLNQPRIHRLDEPDFGGRQCAEVFGSHKEWRQ